tara:strand:- start:9904 stop:10773 length:870 start_codon:yes stop_codon:yes gene_type:complete
MKTLLNHDNQAATIEVSTGYNSQDKKEIFTSKTWGQLTGSDKQSIASAWIKDHVYCNVNQVMELLSQNDDHGDYDEYMSIAEYQDFDQVSTDHINDLTIDELIEIAEDLDDVDHVELFKTKYLDDLLENTNNTNLDLELIHHIMSNTFLVDVEESKANESTLLHFLENDFLRDSNNFDALDTCITELGINFDGYLKAYQSDLSTLVIDNIDLEQYGKDNDLDCDYEYAYEFYSVSDHFVSMLSNSEQCSNDILGLSVWARYCTGQSIVLDHQIQFAAFKALSDCSYTNY